jgi:hypothetical protein
MNALQLTSERQAVWSQTANRLRTRSTQLRSCTLTFTIVGAILAMIASQLPEGRMRLSFAIFSTLLFAAASFVTARLLGQDRTLAGVRARAAAEALKREVFKYTAHAAPYDGDDRDARLNTEREQVENDVSDLLNEVVEPTGDGGAPTSDLTPAEYMDRRIQKQVTHFFEPRAATAARQLKYFRQAEFALASVAACITAAVGVAGKTALAGDSSPGWGFDFVALATVLTTVSGAILVHIEAQRYEHIVSQYRATARRLRDMLASAPHGFNVPSLEWSQFVAKCEAILVEENNSWVAKWSKP